MITVKNADYLVCPSSSGGKGYNITTFTNSLNGFFAVLAEYGKIGAPNFAKSTHIFKSEEDMNAFVANKIGEKIKKGYKPENPTLCYEKSALGKLNRKIEVAHHSQYATTLTFGAFFFEKVRTIGTAFCGIGDITNPLTTLTSDQEAERLAEMANELNGFTKKNEKLIQEEENRKVKAYKGQWGLWS